MVLLTTISQAQENRKLSLQDCIDIALKNNVDVLNTGLDKANAKNAYINSYGQKIPTLSINGNQAINSGYTIDPFTNQFVTKTIRSNNFSIVSTVTLFSGNQINNTHSRLKSVYQASEYSESVIRNQIILETAQYYVTLLSAYKVAEAAQIRLNKVTSDKERMQRRVDAKISSKSELADFDAQSATEELNLSRAKGDISRQKIMLAQRMNEQEINFEIVVPNIDSKINEDVDTVLISVFETALNNLPEIKVSKQNIESNNHSFSIAKGAYLPTITLNGSITTGYSSARSKTTITQGPIIPGAVALRDVDGNLLGTVPLAAVLPSTNSYKTEKYSFSSQFSDNINKSVSIQASIPILNRLTTRNTVQLAQINTLKAQNELKRARQQVFNNVALAITDYKISKANYAANQKQVKSLETALKTAESKKEAGVGTGFDLLGPQFLLASAQANLIQQKFDLVFRKLILNFYSGKQINL